MQQIALYFFVSSTFLFVLVSAATLTVTPHSYFHFFLALYFRSICFRHIQNPVIKMLKKSAWVLWRNSLVNQRLRMAHSLIYCNHFSCHFWWDVVFDRCSSGTDTHDPRKASREKELRGVSSRSITVSIKSNSSTFSVASLVSASPLAVKTVVGFSMSSWCSAHQS